MMVVSETLLSKLIVMRNKIAFATIFTMLLFMASSFAFSQDKNNRRENANNPQRVAIEKVIPNLEHQSISVTLVNINVMDDYHIILYNSEDEVVNTYWVDGISMTMFVGPLSPGDYELELVKGKTTLDRKEAVLK
jgi:hypothetical protein